jgi:hypothetical protein
MTDTKHARLLAVAARLEAAAPGIVAWRVATPDGAFCRQFTERDTAHPEQACRQLIREYAEYAAARQYTAQKVHVYSYAEELMREAAAEIRLIARGDVPGDQPGVEPGVTAPSPGTFA